MAHCLGQRRLESKQQRSSMPRDLLPDLWSRKKSLLQVVGLLGASRPPLRNGRGAPPVEMKRGKSHVQDSCKPPLESFTTTKSSEL